MNYTIAITPVVEGKRLSNLIVQDDCLVKASDLAIKTAKRIADVNQFEICADGPTGTMYWEDWRKDEGDIVTRINGTSVYEKAHAVEPGLCDCESCKKLLTRSTKADNMDSDKKLSSTKSKRRTTMEKKTKKKATPAEVETKKKVKKSAEAEATKKGAPSGPRAVPEGYVSATMLAAELGIEPTALRRRLRALELTKPEGGWQWKEGSKELTKLRKDLTAE